MKNRMWIGAAAGTAAVMVAGGLWIDALRTGHTDGGLKTEPKAAGLKAEPKTGGTPSSGAMTECTGTAPLDSLPGFPGAEGGSDDTPLYRTLAYIDLDAKHRHSDVFTGLSIDARHHTLKVWRIPSAALDADLCGAAEKGVKIRLYDTDVNRKTLDGIAGRISKDMTRWDGTFLMATVGVDAEGFVSIGVDDPAKAEPILKETYGAKYLKVEYAERPQEAPGTLAG